MALPYEEGHAALAARNAPLLAALEEIGVDSVEETPADPANTDSPLLFHLERGFGASEPQRRPLDESLVFLRSAGERGEAEAIAVEVARLLADGTDPEEIAIVVRDPARRGPLLASILESYGVPTALEAEVPVATTSVGGSLIALLEAVLGTGRATDLLRYLRGPSGTSPGRVDWFERSAAPQSRPDRGGGAAALGGEIRRAARGRRPGARGGGPTAEPWPPRSAALARGDGRPRRRSELEARAAGAIATAMAERAELDGLAPLPESIARALARDHGAGLERAGRGPGQDHRPPPGAGGALRQRLRRLPAGRRVPARRGARRPVPLRTPARVARPAAAPRQRGRGALPVPRLPGAAAASGSSSPTATATRTAPPRHPPPSSTTSGRLLEPSRATERPRPRPRRGRPPRRRRALGDRAGAGDRRPGAERRPASGCSSSPAPRTRPPSGSGPAWRAPATAEAATRAPGPLSNPSVIAALGEVDAYGGTTLEGFDVCSYRWFVSHELSPQPLDPPPDPLVQGGIVHAALYALYKERPGGRRRSPGPTRWAPGSPAAASWSPRSRRRGGSASTPPSGRCWRRVEGLLARFLAEEAGRETGGFEPWLLEEGFSEAEEVEQPALEIDGWRLHGAIDRVDRAPDGRALVLDYKLSSKVTPREKLEEEAKLQLQLYLIAVAELWGTETVGGLYHPLRGTSERRPRGLVREDAAADLAGYGLSKTDKLDGEQLEELLADARRRAGEIVARMRAGQIDRDPGPRRACATTASARRSATSRRSAAATGRRSSRWATRRRTSDERAAADARAARGDRGDGQRGAGRGGRRNRQDRGRWSTATAGWSATRASPPTRSSPSPSPTRPPPSCASESGPRSSGAPRRDRSAPASCCPGSAAPG